MKILSIKYIIIFAFVGILMGCSEDFDSDYLERHYHPSLESLYLGVNPRDFDFGNGEQEKHCDIYTGNTWSFTGVPLWLSLSQTSGKSSAEISIASKANESVLSREAIFYISAKNSESEIQRTLTASQSGASPYITFPEYSSSTIEIDGKNNYLIIDVNSNIPDLTVSFSQTWGEAFYNAEAKTVNIELQANETDFSRNGVITVTSKEYNTTAKLTISQLASEVSVLEGIAMDFDANGGTQTRTISSDLDWTAKTTYPWIEFSPKSGKSGDTEVRISVLPSYEADKRIGQIYFYYNDTQKKYIGITQTGRYLNVSVEVITLSADENSSEEVIIDSNIEWEVVSCPEWLSVSQSSGDSGKTPVTIYAQKNNSLNSRAGTIKIKDSKSGGMESEIVVTQKGLDFGDQVTVEFGWKASQQILNIPIPNSWNAAVSSDWISLSDYSGTGEKQIMVSVTKNDDEDLRSGSIVFTSEGKTFSINIIQSGQYINIASTSGEFAAMGGDLILSISSSLDVKELIEYQSEITDWVKIEKTKDGTFKIKVDFNPSINDRTALLKISPTDSEASTQGVIYTIKQFGRGLAADKSQICMFAKGGTSDAVSISCDGSYSIEKDSNDYWYTLVPNYDNNSFYIVVTENTLSEDREGNVNILLKELPQDEEKALQIKVHQYQSGINIEFEPFDNDINW